MTTAKRGSKEGAQAPSGEDQKRAKADAEWRAEKRCLLEAARAAHFSAWEERDKFDAANWFRIPDFHTRPADVDFNGFEGPAVYFWNPEVAGPVRELLRTARTLLTRAGVLSMWDMYARLDEAHEIYRRHSDDKDLKGHEHLSEQQRAAMLYSISVGYLRAFTTRRSGASHEDVMSLANAAEWISAWALDGASVALGKLEERQRQPKDASLNDRPNGRRIDREAVIAKYHDLIAKGRSEADARSILVGLGIGSKSQIWRITTGNTKAPPAKKSFR